MKNRGLKQRILDISYKHKLSHLSSCFTAVDIINDIYTNHKRPTDRFVLSQGHAGLALYVVLEKEFGFDAEELVTECGIHPDRLGSLKLYEYTPIDCSSGSLGLGLTVALGMASGNKNSNIHCLISDGEASEGSVWEALLIKRKYKIDNLKVYMNVNGYSAYDETRPDLLPSTMFNDIDVRLTTMDYMPKYLQGLSGHYHVLSEEQYKECTEALRK